MRPSPVVGNPAAPAELSGPILVSVVIPARNAAATLDEQLDALSRQRFPGRWEVAVVDDGSEDDTAAIVRAWADRDRRFRLIQLPPRRAGEQVRRGPNGARNAGVQSSRAEFVAFCDADDVVAPDWLDALVAALSVHDAVGGRVAYTQLNQPLVRRRYYPVQDERLPDLGGFLPYAVTANFAVRRQVFDAVGGFDESYPVACEDIDMCWRLQLAGHRLGFAPDAVVQYRYRTTFAGMVGQAVRYGRAQPQLFKTYRERGMEPATGKATRDLWVGLLRAGRLVLRRRYSSRRWAREVAYNLGKVVGSVEQRVWYP